MQNLRQCLADIAILAHSRAKQIRAEKSPTERYRVIDADVVQPISH